MTNNAFKHKTALEDWHDIDRTALKSSSCCLSYSPMCQASSTARSTPGTSCYWSTKIMTCKIKKSTHPWKSRGQEVYTTNLVDLPVADPQQALYFFFDPQGQTLFLGIF